MVGTWGQKSEELFIHTPSVVGSSYCSCFGEMIVPGSFSNAKLPALNIRTITLSPVQSWAGLCAHSMTVLAGGMNWKLEPECSPAGDLQSRGFAWSHDECHRFFPCSFPWNWIFSFFYKVKEVVLFIVHLSSLFCFGGPAANNELSCGF